MDHLQAEVTFKSIEVAVAVKKFVTRLNADGRDETVDCLADSDTTPPQEAIILGGEQGDFSSAGFKDG